MRAHVRFMRNEETIDVPPGGILGRSPLAAMPFSDPRVSEAHALVSLREGRLLLLALRRRFAVDGRTVNECELEEGQLIHLAPGLAIEVVELVLSESLLAVEGTDLPLQLLPDVASWLPGTPSRLVARHDPRAAVTFWGEGTEMKARAGDGPIVDASDGHHWTINDRHITIRAIPRAQFHHPTTPAETAIVERFRLSHDGPRVIVTSLDGRSVALDGLMATLVLAIAGSQHIHWTSLCQRLWPIDTDWDTLRGRLDVLLSRLRKKLRDGGLPPTLVRFDGGGILVLADSGHDAPSD
jgi:hypothetical protein